MNVSHIEIYDYWSDKGVSYSVNITVSGLWEVVYRIRIFYERHDL